MRAGISLVDVRDDFLSETFVRSRGMAVFFAGSERDFAWFFDCDFAPHTRSRSLAISSRSRPVLTLRGNSTAMSYSDSGRAKISRFLMRSQRDRPGRD